MTTTLTPEQLAERWQLSSNTLANWRSQGIGPVYLRLGSRVAYRIHDVEAFEQRALHQSPSHRVAGAAA